MTHICPECGREATSKQTWWQPNMVKYHAYLHEDGRTCRVKVKE